MNKLTELFLNRRGYTPEFLQNIENTQHPKLYNMDKLCGILKQIHDQREKIVIMPDFDTDGISAAQVGFAGLAQLGFNVALFAPDPSAYGIRPDDIYRVKRSWPDVKWIITCDVGITCYSAFKAANKLGIKVLITDHHEEKADIPIYDVSEVIVDPCQFADNYPLQDICGAHVLYQVLVTYASYYADQATYNLIVALGISAGIGTIGDMMRVIKENRALVRYAVNGLRYLYDSPNVANDLPSNACLAYRRLFIGLKVFMLQLHKHGKLRSSKDLDEKWIGWTLAPTYNSAKRMVFSMKTVFGIFFGANTDIQSDCAEKLIKNNELRKTKTGEYIAILKQSVASQKQPWAPFIYTTPANGGFLGLIANQLMRESGIPTFVINEHTLSGSGRSLSFFPVIEALKTTQFASQIKGHNLAFGIRFKDTNDVNAFYAYLMKNIMPLVEKAVQEGPKENYDIALGSLNAQNSGDAQINLNDDLSFFNEVNRLKPFGMGIPEPKIAVIANPKMCQFYTMGSENQHLKIITPENMQLISWNNASKIDDYRNSDELQVTGNFSVNEFRGQKQIQLIFQ